jgi:hypothetical protein
LQNLLFDYFCLPRDYNFSLLINCDRCIEEVSD